MGGVMARNHCKLKLTPSTYGMCTALEFAMEFRRWADAQTSITPESIANRWAVSRATSYRWLASYNAVREREALAA